MEKWLKCKDMQLLWLLRSQQYEVMLFTTDCLPNNLCSQLDLKYHSKWAYWVQQHHSSAAPLLSGFSTCSGDIFGIVTCVLLLNSGFFGFFFFLDYLGEAQGPKFDLRLSPFTLVLNKNTGMLMGEALQLSVISFWDRLLLWFSGNCKPYLTCSKPLVIKPKCLNYL